MAYEITAFGNRYPLGPSADANTPAAYLSRKNVAGTGELGYSDPEAPEV